MASIIGRKGALDSKKVVKLAKHMPFPQHEVGGMALWKKFALFGAIPSVGILTLKTILDVKNQPHEERPEFVAYDHLRIRNKRFPWGNGQKSLFHNPHVNPLPTGFEDH